MSPGTPWVLRTFDGRVVLRVSGLVALVSLTVIAFAANSVICRLALGGGLIDAPRFTAVRLLTGAAMLAVYVLDRPVAGRIDPGAAGALFVYACGFSWAYLHIDAGVGALLLFGAVQVTMIGRALARGERLPLFALLGWLLAAGGLVAYLAPTDASVPRLPACSMLVAGVAWGVYSLRGAAQGDPIVATVRNFIATVPAAFLLLAWPAEATAMSVRGFVLAALSGALTSGLGYVLWYRVLRRISAISAAVVQLSVPIVAGLLGMLLLNERIGPRLVYCGVAILGGIGLVIAGRYTNRGGARR